MLRFLGTLAGVVAAVWMLSLFAVPSIPEVEGRDLALLPEDPTHARGSPADVEEIADAGPAAAAAKEGARGGDDGEGEKKVEKKTKGKKGGTGRRH